MMLDTAFYREKLNENRFVIFIYYECRYAQFVLSSVIELPSIRYIWLRHTDSGCVHDTFTATFLRLHSYFYDQE
mgnify:CR=1 FL=1